MRSSNNRYRQQHTYKPQAFYMVLFTSFYLFLFIVFTFFFFFFHFAALLGLLPAKEIQSFGGERRFFFVLLLGVRTPEKCIHIYADCLLVLC